MRIPRVTSGRMIHIPENFSRQHINYHLSFPFRNATLINSSAREPFALKSIVKAVFEAKEHLIPRFFILKACIFRAPERLSDAAPPATPVMSDYNRST